MGENVRKIQLVALLTLMLTSVFTMALSTQQVNAEQREVGVEVGDWTKYDFVYNYATNDPAQPPPEMPDIEQILIEVLSITSSNITFQLTNCYKNGTETSYVAWTDISYQILTFFNAANLSVGDQLYVGPYSFPINATLRRTYAGAERDVNYIGRTYNSSVTFGLLVNGSVHIYWDRVTGVLDEMSFSQHFTNLTQGYTTHTFTQYVIQETNIWSPTYISAEVNITPKSLNLRSKGRWLRACIKIPKGYDVNGINIATVKLNGTVDAEFKSRIVRGKWRDSNRGLMVKFERQAVIDLILKDKQYNKFGTVALTITGSLRDGTQFQGSDSIKVIMSMPPRTWRLWRFTPRKHFGSTPLGPNWNPARAAAIAVGLL